MISFMIEIYFGEIIHFLKVAVHFHFKVPICDLWENGKIYENDSCKDYICGLKH
jgi:hypothetical protein